MDLNIVKVTRQRSWDDVKYLVSGANSQGSLCRCKCDGASATEHPARKLDQLDTSLVTLWAMLHEPRRQTDPLGCSAKGDRLVRLSLSEPNRRQVHPKSPNPTRRSAEGLLMWSIVSFVKLFRFRAGGRERRDRTHDLRLRVR